MNDDATFTLRLARIRRVASPLILAVLAASGLALTLSALSGPHLDSDSPTPAAALGTVFAIATAWFGWLTWRGLRVRVVITRSAVELHNVLGTKHIGLDDIAGFETARRTQISPPHTLLRLHAGHHGIPRSVDVPAASPATALDDALAIVMWMLVGMQARVRMGKPLAPEGGPSRLDRPMREIVDAMNAELDHRRGGPRTADLLAAAHPPFRTMLHED